MAAKRGRPRPAVTTFYRQNRRRAYMGDIRAAPFAVEEGGEPATPYLGLWADADTGEVVSAVVAIERPADALAEALINPTRGLPGANVTLDDSGTGAMTVVKAYELPGRAILFDPALAGALRPRLTSRGIALVTSERIDFFEDMFASMFDQLAAAAPPPELDMPDDVLASLCAAAERLWREKPWRYCHDEPPIGVEPLDGTSRPVYAVVLGRGGEVFGVALYSSLEDYEALTQLDDPPPEGAPAAEVFAFGEAIAAAHRHRTYLVSFDVKAEADSSYVDRLVTAGWSRRYRVVPSFVGHGGQKPTTLFAEADARRFSTVLDAVTAFCQQARDRIAELDYAPVQLVAEVTIRGLDGPKRFRVTMPPDAPTPDRRRRRQRASGKLPPSPPAFGSARTEASAPATADSRTRIDDPDAATRLMDDMQSHLPIPASVTPELVRIPRSRGLSVGHRRSLVIGRLFYMGDEGGICCDVTSGGDPKDALVVSLTHLRLPPSHPLYQRINAYQRERVGRLRTSRR
ncbi:MAG: hypothetical protein EPO26_18685 [Chloroflexota bacterium]|nr:MAG: hypothetical protein EPO26_18685 [Chloroflexota bacterium]